MRTSTVLAAAIGVGIVGLVLLSAATSAFTNLPPGAVVFVRSGAAPFGLTILERVEVGGRVTYRAQARGILGRPTNEAPTTIAASEITSASLPKEATRG